MSEMREILFNEENIRHSITDPGSDHISNDILCIEIPEWDKVFLDEFHPDAE